ncbi:MAG: serine acetyltransferase [Burkholderiaceae bacterium]|jgi:serine O-acetyltransferase|nr:serine acetyltransferase [Burkholderiaceae bacterium]
MGTGLSAVATTTVASHSAPEARGEQWGEAIPPPQPPSDITSVVCALHQARQDWRAAQGREREPLGRELPSIEAVAQMAEQIKGALFPMRLGPVGLRYESEDAYVAYTLHAAMQTLEQQAQLELAFKARLGSGGDDAGAAPAIRAQAKEAVQALMAALPEIRRLLDSDVLAAYRGDPAAQNVDEVLLCYPGMLAIIHHRIAHVLYAQGLRLLARIVSELAHGKTGIDIHPGARIGSGFFIDHGTGVVIGETCVIGENVRIYQAVTLGARRFSTGEDGHLLKGEARHPVVEDDVVIYAGATILGRITLGKGASIGGNVWITHDVAPGVSVSQAKLQHHQG